MDVSADKLLLSGQGRRTDGPTRRLVIKSVGGFEVEVKDQNLRRRGTLYVLE